MICRICRNSNMTDVSNRIIAYHTVSFRINFYDFTMGRSNSFEVVDAFTPNISLLKESKNKETQV